MNFGILTWYKSVNHGAVLQAYASQRFLESNGIVNSLIDYEREIMLCQTWRELLQRRVQKLLSLDFRNRAAYQLYNAEKSANFEEFRNRYLNIEKRFDQDEYDCVMIGSDMVFSLIQGYSGYMFGEGVHSKYFFSYAASSGGTNVSLVRKLGVFDKVRDGLNRFDSLGYRDVSTRAFIEEISGRKDLVETIDPVLLYGFDIEKQDWHKEKWENHPPYVLLYSYQGDMNDGFTKRSIIRFARQNGLKTVSCGYYHPWCDENVNASPEEFLDVINCADYVVTDTFHGTVFSIICKKEFVSFIRGNGFKLEYLLKSCGLENRIVHKVKEIAKVFENKTNYAQCDQWLKTEREKSGNYILSNVKAAIEVSSYKQEEDLVN